MVETKNKQTLPWRHAESLQTCCLLWISVKLDAIPNGQREWLLEFFLRLSARLDEMDLRGEHFMQMQTIDENQDIRDIFLNGMLKDSPLIGVSRHLHQQEVAIPRTEEIEAFAKKKKEFHAYDYMPTNACWFLNQDGHQLRQKYLGYGGLTFFYRKKDQKDAVEAAPLPAMPPLIIPKFLRQDPKVKLLLEGFDPKNPGQIPPFLRNHPGMKQIFSTFEAEKMQERSDLLLSPFRSRSKEIFGEDMPRDLKFESLPFILPRLSSQDFFTHTEKQIRQWFDLFDVYVAEISADEGIVMACKDNLTPLIATIADEMRGDGYRYWEG